MGSVIRGKKKKRRDKEEKRRQKLEEEYRKQNFPEDESSEEDYSTEDSGSSSDSGDPVMKLKNFDKIAATGQLFLKYTGKRRRKPQDRIVKVSFDNKYKPKQISWGSGSRHIDFNEILYIAWGHWTPVFEARRKAAMDEEKRKKNWKNFVKSNDWNEKRLRQNVSKRSVKNKRKRKRREQKRRLKKRRKRE